MEVTLKEIQYTAEFEVWEDSLPADIRGLVRVRLARVAKGLFGNSHGVGEGVSELVIGEGPGFRVYFGRTGDRVILLTGGAKKTQRKDIRKAKILWGEINA